MPVALPLELDPQPVGQQAVGHRGAEIAGEAVVPVRGEQRQAQRVLLLPLDLPAAFVEGLGPAVQLVTPLVRRQRIAHAAQREGRAGNAVAVAPDARAEEVRPGEVLVYAVVAENRLFSAKLQAYQRRPEVAHADAD